jgi:hypothetical protein
VGKIPGLKQITLYADPALIKMVKIQAVRSDRATYSVVDEALRMYIAKTLPMTAKEREALLKKGL